MGYTNMPKKKKAWVLRGKKYKLHTNEIKCLHTTKGCTRQNKIKIKT